MLPLLTIWVVLARTRPSRLIAPPCSSSVMFIMSGSSLDPISDQASRGFQPPLKSFIDSV